MSVAASPAPSIHALQAVFLTQILPRVQTHGEVCFHSIKCVQTREERIAEMTALAWRWFLRLVEKGKDVSQFPTALATFAAKAVRAGRRVCGQERAKDAMSPRAQRRRNFRVETLPSSTRRPFDDFYGNVHGQQDLDAYEERLKDNTVTPPPDAAAFRIDWPDFLRTLTERDRELALFLSLGHPAKVAAERFGLSPGRVTQLRQRWCQEWRACQGEQDRAGQREAARA
jgi:hypothetical protein